MNGYLPLIFNGLIIGSSYPRGITNEFVTILTSDRVQCRELWFQWYVKNGSYRLSFQATDVANAVLESPFNGQYREKKLLHLSLKHRNDK